MPDEEKRDDNLHELDQEPATGSSNEATNDSDDTTQEKASSTWSSNHTEHEHGDKAPVSPLHDDIAPATIPMSTRPKNEQAQPTASKTDEELPKPGPGLMVLQWLTYAFWGWTVFSLSGLVITVVSQLLDHTSDNYWLGSIAYLLAAVIVLFIISLVTDIFYANAEKKHARTGGTSVIMIIHAVIFALFGIGALILSVFALVSLLINDTSSTTGPLSGIISGAVIAVLYGLTLVRTLRPRWVKAVVPVYWIIMTLTIIVTVTLGIIGPAAQVRLQNEDAVTEQGLPEIADAVNSYATAQAKLPRSLSSLSSLPEKAQKLVDENKVTYTPGEKIVTPNTDVIGAKGDSSSLAAQTPVFHYELCVDYKAKDAGSDYSYRPSTNGQSYPTSIYTYGHKAGHVCYDVQTDYIYNY